MQKDVTTAIQGTGLEHETWVLLLVILCMCYNYKHQYSISCILNKMLPSIFMLKYLSSIVPTEGKLVGEFLLNA